MIVALYIAVAVIMAGGSLYFAWRNRDFRKFLAGAFFVSSGILFISISPMCRCLCWERASSKHPGSVAFDPLSISCSSWCVSILALSESQGPETCEFGGTAVGPALGPCYVVSGAFPKQKR